MPNSKRAAQFMPFDALKGYKEEITKQQKIQVDKKELCDDQLELNTRVLKQLKVGMMVTIIYYEDHEYLQLIGMVSEINEIYHYIQIVKKKVSFDDIYSITSKDVKNDYFD